MPKQLILSIIIPAFNAEKYLKQCLNSVLAQTLENFEIILIENGSTDKTPDIVSEYRNNPLIKIVSIKKNNITEARNIGLKLARGKYIGFVDADDWISSAMYNKMISVAENGDYDIVSCSYYNYFEESNILSPFDDSLPRNICIKNNNNGIVGAEALLLDDAFIWNRIFKKDMVLKNHINFPPDIFIASDTYFYRIALCSAKNICYIPDKFYYYRTYRQNSITKTFDNKLYSYFTNCDLLYKYIIEKNLLTVIPWYNHLVLSFLSTGYTRISQKYKSEYFKKFVDFIHNKNIKNTDCIAFPSCTNSSLIYKLRYFSLKYLHCMILYTLLNKSELLFNTVITIRILMFNIYKFLRFKIKK